MGKGKCLGCDLDVDFTEIVDTVQKKKVWRVFNYGTTNIHNCTNKARLIERLKERKGGDNLVTTVKTGYTPPERCKVCIYYGRKKCDRSDPSAHFGRI